MSNNDNERKEIAIRIGALKGRVVLDFGGMGRIDLDPEQALGVAAAITGASQNARQQSGLVLGKEAQLLFDKARKGKW